MPIIILSSIAAAYSMMYMNHCAKSKSAPKIVGAAVLTLICALAFALALYTIIN